MSAYQNTARGGDTDFRRKWDREEYAQLASEREAREKAEAKARYEAKMSGKKVKSDDTPNPDAKAITARKAQDWSEVVNKTYLVPFGASVGRRGKGAGFYCEACDETYKDNNSWIDHINSRQHLKKTGQTFDQEKSTLDECVARLEMLKERKRQQEKQVVYDINDSVAARTAKDEAERAAKKAKRKENKEKGKEAHIKNENGGNDAEIASMMGFGGFV
ncbi:Putative uncharacterized protein [Taphrina deformans PYCC 5710]|uniref:C2H2-type domain-containing protein n=1 Tax=Taphrina deformans (strain PYCC 5710 / ATCC 11124 / CBS 356.35 / IMI 108563 / JCM 9778 / NBRC 8474) TaxID=1097556 RepID=R4X8N4_TAPDE|nr:Putative uncharacterized protein [Taphrina deformans PYCC 5710]|eukprot:CCG81988.1 Putative uncharacterized protein [Taphrina deformans PYCC 5710]